MGRAAGDARTLGRPNILSMLTEEQIWRLFSKPEFVGAVLRLAALLEYDLDSLLCAYFIRPDRLESALELLFADVTVGRKLEMLRKLPVPKQLTSYRKAVAGLSRFQRIRNIAAHQWSVPRRTVHMLLEDRGFRDLLARYPEGLQEDFRATRASIWRLRRTKTWGVVCGTVGELDSLAVLKVLKDSES
jgi:hypothetical protein